VAPVDDEPYEYRGHRFTGKSCVYVRYAVNPSKSNIRSDRE
jgi:hypothetical protein